MTLEFGRGPLAGVDLAAPRTHAEQDLGEVWRLLREQQPVAWHPAPTSEAGGFWVVTRFADAVEVYRNPDVFTSARGNMLTTLLAGGDSAGGQMLVLSDGPRTLAIRRRLLRAFTPKALRGIGATITESTRALVGAAVARGTCDFASEVAEHIPLDAICDLLRVPEGDRKELFVHASTALAAETADATVVDARRSRNELLMYFARHAARCEHDDRDDVMSILLQLTREPLALSTQELLLNCYSLLLGGDETSRLALVGTVETLARWPEQWQRLRRGEVALSTAVEELLRWTTPALHTGRTATAEYELAGQKIAAGQVVTVWNSSANFDPDQFTQPDQLDLGRTPNRHLVFGHGNHFCLGAQLARIELRAVLEALLDTTEDIELLDGSRRLYSSFLSGFSKLPARLHPRRQLAHQEQTHGAAATDILWLGQPGCDDPALVGGKAANLSRLAAGYTVPPGFCLNVSARGAWSGGALPAALQTAVAAAYEELAARSGAADPVVAVRSSAADEDGASASFAGIYLSCLNVRSVAGVLDAIARCWASANEARVRAYREGKGGGDGAAAIGVLVQELVLADSAAVVFSVNPSNGAADELVINANWGLGESIVSGVATPDTWIVGRPALETRRFVLGDKSHMTVRAEAGTSEVPVLRTLRARPCLSEAQVHELASLALRLEEDMGWPVDIECAYHGDTLYLLQCRPITTLKA